MTKSASARALKNATFALIYTLFLFPTFVGTVLFLSFEGNHYQSFVFGGSGMIEAFALVTLIGGVFFWVGNMLVNRIEDMGEQNATRHFRQCSLFYILLLISLYLLVREYSLQYGSLYYGYVAMIAFISFWAIAINAVFLKRK